MNKTFIETPTDTTLVQTEEWFGHFPENEMAFKEADYSTLLHGARNVIFVEGTACGKLRLEEALEAAAHEAESAANNFDFWEGKKYLIQIIADEKEPLCIGEMKALKNFMAQMSNGVEMKYTVNQAETRGKVIVKIAATDLPEK